MPGARHREDLWFPLSHPEPGTVSASLRLGIRRLPHQGLRPGPAPGVPSKLSNDSDGPSQAHEASGSKVCSPPTLDLPVCSS